MIRLGRLPKGAVARRVGKVVPDGLERRDHAPGDGGDHECRSRRRGCGPIFACHGETVWIPSSSPVWRPSPERCLPGVDDLADARRHTIGGVLTSLFRQAVGSPRSSGAAPGLDLHRSGRAAGHRAGVMPPSSAHSSGRGGPGDLSSRLGPAGGRFCDVGTGTGWLAITAAQRWPNLRSSVSTSTNRRLALARRQHRSGGRRPIGSTSGCSTCGSSPTSSGFDLVWLPGPFLPGERRSRGRRGGPDGHPTRRMGGPRPVWRT